MGSACLKYNPCTDKAGFICTRLLCTAHTGHIVVQCWKYNAGQTHKYIIITIIISTERDNVMDDVNNDDNTSGRYRVVQHNVYNNHRVGPPCLTSVRRTPRRRVHIVETTTGRPIDGFSRVSVGSPIPFVWQYEFRLRLFDRFYLSTRPRATGSRCWNRLHRPTRPSINEHSQGQCWIVKISIHRRFGFT